MDILYKIRFYFLIHLCLLSLISCSKPNKNETTVEEQTIQKTYSIPVETLKLYHADVTKFYHSTAILEATLESKVVNKVSGMINLVSVKEGDFVKNGQILAEIEPEKFQLEYNKAQIELESVQAEFKRSHPINGNQIVSSKDLEKLSFQVKSQKIQRDIASIQLSNTKITSPISGYVVANYVKPNNMVGNLNNEMFHIIALDPLQGVVNLPESEYHKVKTGQLATLIFPTKDPLTVMAHIDRIPPLIDSKNGTFKVFLKVDNANGQLTPGMFAKVKLVLDTHKEVPVLPQKAILITEKNKSVFIVEDNIAKRVTVTTGYEQDDVIEITSGLVAGTEVVVVGQFGLKDNSKVKTAKTDLKHIIHVASNNKQ